MNWEDLTHQDLTVNETNILPERERIVLSWEDLATGESGNIELERAWLDQAHYIFEVFCRKQKSYGPNNIAKFAEKGVIIRINDKLERLITLNFNDVENPLEDETQVDTWVDLADYGIIGLLCYLKKWPGVK